ncbi:hypothetical protein ACFLVZ_03210 [Chloroflexota bacterium]
MKVIDPVTIKNWYEKILKEYTKVDGEFHALRKRREELTVQLTSLEPLLAQAGISIDDLKQNAKPKNEQTVVDVSDELKPLSEAIIEILKNSSGPMHYGDILISLKEKGYDVGGRDPRNTILAHISRHKKWITKAPESSRGYYKLKD